LPRCRLPVGWTPENTSFLNSPMMLSSI